MACTFIEINVSKVVNTAKQPSTQPQSPAGLKPLSWKKEENAYEILDKAVSGEGLHRPHI